jgi:hypothetical protein
MSERTTEYHGYSNYPTWAVTQWLSGEEEAYRASQGVLLDAGNTFTGADDLKEWVEGANPLAEAPSLYSDLLGWALQAVNWEEISRKLGPEEWSTPDVDDRV